MTRPQIALVLHALALIAALAYIVPALTEAWGPWGYLLSLGFYWLGFCLPVIAIHAWNRDEGRLLSERLAWRDWFLPVLLLLQVGGVALTVLLLHSPMLTTQAAMLAVVVGLINGPLAELAWRGGFLTAFRDRPRTGFWLSWLLYTAWHIPLTLSHDVELGGAATLVGGAAGLGLLWNWIAWRTGSVFWTTIAHVLTNVLTFWVFFNANGIVTPHP